MGAYLRYGNVVEIKGRVMLFLMFTKKIDSVSKDKTLQAISSTRMIVGTDHGLGRLQKLRYLQQ